MTALFAKVFERLIRLLFCPYYQVHGASGKISLPTQKPGARDAILFLVLSWLAAFKEKASIADYMSDVSGAFDCVSAPRRLKKTAPQDVLDVISSWLRNRTANVIVDGKESGDVS